MTHSTIYDMKTGYTIADGVQSQRVCNDTINTARSIARDKRHSVIVEDRGTGEIYRVTPAGYIWRAPQEWLIAHDEQEED